MEKSKKLIYLEKILRWMAIRVLKKYKPKIVAITGSVGKTTTKEMVSRLLSKYHTVRKNEKNYNNEVGVPLTIIGARSGEGSVSMWLPVFLKWLKIFILPVKYPEVLILEMGADRPGDIKYLCGFVPIDVGVITNVGISHLEYFKTKEALAKEKGALLRSMKSSGLAIINKDDKLISKMENSLRADVLSYGIESKADIIASDILYGYRKLKTRRGEVVHLVQGVMFKLNYEGKIIPVKLSRGLGHPQVYAALATFAVGRYFKINTVEAAQIIDKFYPPRGRMILLGGIKNTAIIDDSYNSAPDSVQAVYEVMSKIDAKRKILVMGDMLELGPEEEAAHKKVGKWSADLDASYLITIGNRMKFAAKSFKKAAKPQQKQAHFDNPMEAGIYVQNILEEGDVVLIKGSQGIRVEKIVEEIMSDPENKEDLLVRQDETWQKKEFVQP